MSKWFYYLLFSAFGCCWKYICYSRLKWAKFLECAPSLSIGGRLSKAGKIWNERPWCDDQLFWPSYFASLNYFEEKFHRVSSIFLYFSGEGTKEAHLTTYIWSLMGKHCPHIDGKMANSTRLMSSPMSLNTKLSGV